MFLSDAISCVDSGGGAAFSIFYFHRLCTNSFHQLVQNMHEFISVVSALNGSLAAFMTHPSNSCFRAR